MVKRDAYRGFHGYKPEGLHDLEDVLIQARKIGFPVRLLPIHPSFRPNHPLEARNEEDVRSQFEMLAQLEYDGIKVVK